MANTMQDFFNVEEEAYKQALSKKLGVKATGVNKDAISKKIKELEQANTGTKDVAEKQQALNKLNELKKLNDDYQKFLSEKDKAVETDSMPNFTFYPGDRSGVDHIEIRLPDGSKQRWPQASGSGISAVLKDKFTVAMPLNSTLIVHSNTGGVLELSPGNRVSAPFTSTNMDIEDFCQHTYDNWIKADKKQPINLNFSSIPPEAQPEIKKRVAQRLIDIHADSVEFASLDTRQGACNEMVRAITTVSEANQQPAFPSRKYLKDIGVSEWGTTWAFKRDPNNVVADQRNEALKWHEALKNRHPFNQPDKGKSGNAQPNDKGSQNSDSPTANQVQTKTGPTGQNRRG
jgi:hypothetical protein